MYILDTDAFNYFLRGDSRLLERIRTVGSQRVGTSIVTRIELLRGRIEFILKAANAAELLRAQMLLEQTEIIITQFPIVPFTTASVTLFEQLNEVSSYRKIGRADLLISSIALANQATLITRNIKDFSRIKNLKLENWVD